MNKPYYFWRFKKVDDNNFTWSIKFLKGFHFFLLDIEGKHDIMAKVYCDIERIIKRYQKRYCISSNPKF